MNNVRVGVYAICKNESQFVREWVKNMWCDGKGATSVFVLDTGSTDNTLGAFQAAIEEFSIPEGWLTLQQKTYTPWRFDYARNDNMDMLNPDDFDVMYCIDLDELVIEDFWHDLRECVLEHPDFERIHYRYAWSHDSVTNAPTDVFWYDKVHSCTGWRWDYPVHEALRKENADMNAVYWMDSNKIYLHHYPDLTKSRSSYLGLLELRAQEYPEDLYGLFYLQREYSFVEDYENALKVALRLYSKIVSQTSMDIVDDYNMTPSVCVSIANYLRIMGLNDAAEFFYRKAINLNPMLRDGYIELAQMFAYSGEYAKCYDVIDNMDKHSVYTEDWRLVPNYWRAWKRCQILGCAKCWEGKIHESLQLFKTALDDIKTSDDEKAALAANFYEDYQFVLGRLTSCV